MLNVLAPYILGLLTQVGSILGQLLADPANGVTDPIEAQKRRDQFNKDLDAAQLPPSLITVGVVALVVYNDLGETLTAVTVIGAMLLAFALPIWIRSKTATEYANITRTLRLSPVTLAMIIVYVAAGLIAAAVRQWF